MNNTAIRPGPAQTSQAIAMAQAVLAELLKRPRLGLRPLVLTSSAHCKLLALSNRQLLQQLEICLSKIHQIAPAASLTQDGLSGIWTSPHTKERLRQAAIAAHHAYHQTRIAGTEGPTLGEIPLFVTLPTAEQDAWLAAIESALATRAP